jgi:hypothetical protein
MKYEKVGEEPLTKEQVQEWLREAKLNYLTIWHDRNGIIIKLAEELLNYWTEEDYNEDK